MSFYTAPVDYMVDLNEDLDFDIDIENEVSGYLWMNDDGGLSRNDYEDMMLLQSSGLLDGFEEPEYLDEIDI
ncbi:MAG: hypothetical protein II702_02725 [Clostridia bacterium]|jgi:hypothetical protein|nr:hypothetical protein [Clostridia bacterium]MBQ4243804.1 hypothetical protein [Clostridia bacterium]